MRKLGAAAPLLASFWPAGGPDGETAPSVLEEGPSLLLRLVPAPRGERLLSSPIGTPNCTGTGATSSPPPLPTALGTTMGPPLMCSSAGGDLLSSSSSGDCFLMMFSATATAERDAGKAAGGLKRCRADLWMRKPKIRGTYVESAGKGSGTRLENVIRKRCGNVVPNAEPSTPEALPVRLRTGGG